MFKTPEKVLEAYITGTYTADVALLKSVFHPSARMSGYLGGSFLAGGPEPFFEDMASAPSMQEQGDHYQAKVARLEVCGRIADAVIQETGFRGSVSLENHLHLVQCEDGWTIISKTFTTL